MADALWPYVVLCAPFNGANDGTTFTDLSTSAHTITPVGTARTYADAAAIGGSSLLLDAVTAGLEITGTLADWRFGTGDFCVEGFATMPALPATGILFMLLHWSAESDGLPSVNGGWGVYFDETGQITWSKMDGGGHQLLGTGTPAAAAERVHWAYSRSGTTGRLWLRGVQVATETDSTNYNADGGTTALRVSLYANVTVYNFLGRVQARITKGAARYTTAFTPPTEFPTTAGDVVGDVAAAGPLGQPVVRGQQQVATVAAPGPLRGPTARTTNTAFGIPRADGPLGGFRGSALTDFTALLRPRDPIRYVMDLIVPAGRVRVPVSSWQATLQLDEKGYAQCVVPAAMQWLADIELATDFVISRVAHLADGTLFEHEMVRAPRSLVSDAQGSYNASVTLSGYFDSLSVDDVAPAATPRPLTGVRTVTTAGGKTRVRCDVDWLLRPGLQATTGSVVLDAAYVNFYCIESDQYMDAGER